MTAYRLDVVIPCFNEDDNLPVTLPRIVSFLDEVQADPQIEMTQWRVILVDDGSTDKTWDCILAHCVPGRISGIKLSRNFGHQSAMLAGLTHADADAVITMDSDLQDDILVVRDMLLAFQNGFDLALGVRSARDTDTAFKRGTARLYYRLLNAMGTDAVEDHADYRLMSQRALRALLAHDEVNLFIRGLIPAIGFRVSIIPYVRQAREIGESKYTLRKMLLLAIDGITSFSVMPLRLIALIGVVVFMFALATGGAVLVERLFFANRVVPGWASILLPLLALGGVQLLSLGVLGEYVGKIYLETKRRPRFIIETVHDDTSAGDGDQRR
ncbi:glycosyltransferase [Neoasaia chiangmaiensis NBRC 101099]|uniref:Glycosyltransferase n=1 Tax=Neoasaia chiangmaiensis TaxID=320497 RepID=A0A1U9KS52_9PROT|nr:glycosyltransferase family 2 protein [Neoasaia chiangmaiensis]AQS88592.1 glycosyltransferase [Neoasaia chiangmaiensis]GBR36190.1 glycosyltransferase [Neoasaia chiangmaiensis NBRC 101099]GEN15440.1 glycosyl transferase [Neoasaia chiangmaiensis]